MRQALLAFVFLLSAQVVQAASLGAVVQDWHYDPQTNLVTLKISNNSHKDITGFNLAIEETYADGRVEKHQLLSDFVGRLKFLQDVKGTPDEARFLNELGDGLFHPGEIKEELVAVQPALKDFHAEVDVVTYADQTSEATNVKGLQRLTDHRRAEVASVQVADDIIRTALADPDDRDPAATAAAKIDRQLATLSTQPSVTLDQNTLRNAVKELNGMRGDRRALSQYLAKNEQGISTLSPHANLKTEGRPQ
jgi:hypothetical protein